MASPEHLWRYPDPEQALAVFELLDDLREKIRDRYNYRLQDLLQQQLQSPRRR